MYVRIYRLRIIPFIRRRALDKVITKVIRIPFQFPNLREEKDLDSGMCAYIK